MGHVSDSEGVCDGCQTHKHKKQNPHPAPFNRAKKQKEYDAVENRRDVSIWDPEGPGKRCVRDSLTSLAEDGAPETTHRAALVQPNIEHCRSARESERIRKKSKPVICDRHVSHNSFPFAARELLAGFQQLLELAFREDFHAQLFGFVVLRSRVCTHHHVISLLAHRRGHCTSMLLHQLPSLFA